MVKKNQELISRQESKKTKDSRKSINHEKKSKKHTGNSKTKKHAGNSKTKKHAGNSKTKKHIKKSFDRNPKKQKSHHRHSDDDIINGSDIDIVDDYDQENYSHDQNSEYSNNSEVENTIVRLEDKTKERLKGKIMEWLDYDDKIKILNAKAKRYKDAKKQQEELILKMISKLGVNDTKIDVHNDENEFCGRVYRHKSSTKGALKEDIIKDALMEVFRDEKKVVQLLKKIDSKRPINERYYLKRTKGNKDN